MMTCPNTYYHAVAPFITVLIWVPLSRQVRFHHLIFPQVLAESAKLYLNYFALSQLKSEMAVLFKHLAQKRRYVVAPGRSGIPCLEEGNGGNWIFRGSCPVSCPSEVLYCKRKMCSFRPCIYVDRCSRLAT